MDIVTFHSPKEIDDSLIGFSVVVARYRGKWLLCKHKERTTYEVPGGHCEPGETPEQTARRELFEETGALTYTLEEICTYSVEDFYSNAPGTVSYGVLYLADITVLGPLPDFEMASVHLFDTLPDNMTYPHVQPLLVEKVQSALLETTP